VESDVGGVGEAMSGGPVKFGASDGRENALFQRVAEWADGAFVDGKIFGGMVGGCAETDEVWDVFRAASSGAFLMAPVEEGCEPGLAMNVEGSNAFWCACFVSGKGEMIERNGANVDGEFASHLHGIVMIRNATTAAEFSNVFKRKKNAGLVIGPHQGDDSRVLSAGIFQIRHG